MDKNAIKKYAVWARTELITRVSQRAEKYNITAEADANASSVNGALLSDAEKEQRKALIEQVKLKGFDQVMEEVAYTWFNRFIALRFMEVNGYLPSHIRVFTDDNNNFKPQILAEAIHLELDGLDMEKVYEMKNNNENDELYKYLIITQCNSLSSALPGLFQKISDYTELLFPDNVLRDGSIIEEMVALIPEDDWKDQVQIIGWLYQFYYSELKDEVFDRPKTQKIKKEEVPAATQLFTPDWIVRYMVENSLGRLWIEGHPNSELKNNWQFYLDNFDQEADVALALEKIHNEFAELKPEDIKCIDPCSGSGHVCAYLFDVLIQIYEAYGVSARDAAVSIVEHNVYGLDVDDRAAQLARFSVVMKARQYDRRFLTRNIQPHIYSIQESNTVDKNAIDYFCANNKDLIHNVNLLLDYFNDAKEFGSMIRVENVDFDVLYHRFAEVRDDISIFKNYILSEFLDLVKSAELLSQSYHVVVTNPPYMGSKGGMNETMKSYISKHYLRSKSDLYAVFMDVAYNMCLKNGYIAMINQHGWMFLASFSKLRQFIVENESIVNMIHLGTRAFEEIGGEVVQTTTFVLQKSHTNFRGKYIRTTDINSSEEKKNNVLEVAKGISKDTLYSFPMKYFTFLPDNLIGYWISTKLIDIFNSEKPLAEIAKPRQGLSTSDNDRFLRLWFETKFENIGLHYSTREEAAESGIKWFPYNKGGEYRKWYGNNNYVINWQYDGAELREWADYLNTHGTSMGRLVSQEFYFKKGLTWSGVGATRFGVRCYPEGMLFDVGANGLFVDDKYYKYFAAFLNTKLANEMIKVLNPTINTGSGTVGKLPVKIDETKINDINALVDDCVKLVKADWDDYETSWDFTNCPLISGESSIKKSVIKWIDECKLRFNRLKENERQINSIFIEIYGLEDEFTPEVKDEDVSIRIPSELDAVKMLISYSVGCMFGRYSIDTPGLVFAGGKWDHEAYHTITPDADGIIPICDDEYFDDDIVGMFTSFIERAYGKDDLENNLKYIADILGESGTSRNAIRSYFLNSFYADHCSLYSINGSGKRPIYWMFDSGKNNGFKCLIYMHRYQSDTIARIRTDYVHEQQSRYRTAIEEASNRANSVSGSEKVKLDKKIKHLKDQDLEIHAYEEKIHHLADQMIAIDLDDGFKHNYALFEDVVARVK